MNADDSLYALNWDGAVYTHISGDYWVGMGFGLSGATDLERAGDRYSYPNRWFMIKNGNLHFSSAYGVPQTWTEVPLGSLGGGVQSIREITAVGWPVEVYALTESRMLYRARFFETSCSDGIDNDDDGDKDGYDANCIESLAQNVCGQYWAGSYCVSRSGTSSDALADCQSGHLISW